MTSRAFAAVLDDVRFPVRRWQIVTAADGYGIDAATRMKLEQIPDRSYDDVHDVVRALTATPAHLGGREQL